VSDPAGVAAGLLVLRETVGLLTTCHGLQKLTHRFGGQGLAAAGEVFAGMGFRGGTLTAIAAGGTQAFAGVLLVLGFLTPLGGSALLGVMLVAVMANAPQGLWGQNGGYEYPLVLAGCGAVLALTGPGDLAVDTDVLDWRVPLWVSLVAIAVGAASAAVTGWLLRRAPVATGGQAPQ